MRTIPIRGAILVNLENFMPENASFQGYFTEVSFDNSEENQLSFFVKLAILSKFFDDVMSHIIRSSAD